MRGSYGRLRAVRVEEGNEANPAEGVGKRRPEDFALWKATEVVVAQEIGMRACVYESSLKCCALLFGFVVSFHYAVIQLLFLLLFPLIELLSSSVSFTSLRSSLFFLSISDLLCLTLSFTQSLSLSLLDCFSFF